MGKGVVKGTSMGMGIGIGIPKVWVRGKGFEETFHIRTMIIKRGKASRIGQKAGRRGVSWC